MSQIKEVHKRREQDRQWLKFDLTVNLPLIVTLIIGFVSLVSVVVRGYYGHESRINRLEISTSDIERSEVVQKQGVILSQLQQMKDQLDKQERTANERFSRLEDKLDRYIERGRK